MKILNLYAGIGGNRKMWGDEAVAEALDRLESKSLKTTKTIRVIQVGGPAEYISARECVIPLTAIQAEREKLGNKK